MCGICGTVLFDGSAVQPDQIRRMCATLVERGPDDEGVYAGPGVGLGQRRLSIIDLSPEATAPLCNEDGSLRVVFNGEIYNFAALRTDLRGRGHFFRTQTDTEVLLHLYEEHGTGMLHYLRGMFAFALWDDRRKVLFAARDRLGKKPLVFARTPRAFVFGSAVRAVTASGDVPVEPDFSALHSFLTWQYVPSPRTAFRGVQKLPAGHYLVCTADGAVTVERYWSPVPAEPMDADPREMEEVIRAKLRESVRMRLMADVPVGAFLSGGVDSGAVVALMAEASSVPVRTFTIGLEDDPADERPYARQVAERYGTDHHELVVRPQAAEVLPLLVRHYNEPFADPSAIPTFYLSQLTRDHVTVALSGDGGDESFGGYESYRQVLGWGSSDVLPRSLRRTLVAGTATLLEALPYTNRSARLARAGRMVSGSLAERYQLQMSTLKPQEQRMLLTDHFRALASGAEDPVRRFPYSPGEDPLAWMMRHDQSFYLPDCLMVKTDVASMAVSLEVRCPLLDHELVELAAAIPSALKRDEKGGKRIFKSAMAHLLPRDVLEKPKTGFGIPLARWLRSDLRDLLRGSLLDERVARRGLLNRPAVSRMIDEHHRGERDWSTRLWSLLWLELWFREFID